MKLTEGIIGMAGFLEGAGIALGLTAVAAVGLLFLMAAWRYAIR